MPKLTTLAKVKGALQIPAAVTLRDERIAEVIDEAEDALLAETTLSAFEPTVYSERLITNGSAIAQVSRFPVFGFVALTLSGTALVADQDYRWSRHGTVRLMGWGAVFPTSTFDVEACYTAGLVQTAGSTPSELVRLGTLAAARQANLEGLSGMALSSIQPLSQAMATPGNDLILNEINRIMARYRRA